MITLSSTAVVHDHTLQYCCCTWSHSPVLLCMTGPHGASSSLVRPGGRSLEARWWTLPRTHAPQCHCWCPPAPRPRPPRNQQGSHPQFWNTRKVDEGYMRQTLAMIQLGFKYVQPENASPSTFQRQKPRILPSTVKISFSYTHSSTTCQGLNFPRVVCDFLLKCSSNSARFLSMFCTACLDKHSMVDLFAPDAGVAIVPCRSATSARGWGGWEKCSEVE